MHYGIENIVKSKSHLYKLDTKALLKITLKDIEKYYKIPLKKPGTNEDSEVKLFAEQLLFIYNDCGRVLKELNCKDFAQFIRKSLQNSKGSAVKLVEDLVKTFAAYNDSGKLHDGTPVFFFKKAQLTVGELHL